MRDLASWQAMTGPINPTRLLACACVLGALIAPGAAQAANPPQRTRASLSAAARLEASAVADSAGAARVASRSAARALLQRSVKRLQKAYAITESLGGFEAAAKATAGFSTAVTNESDGLLAVIASGGDELDQAAASSLGSVASLQGTAALSLTAKARDVNGATEKSAAATLTHIADQESSVTTGLAAQTSASAQSKPVISILAQTVARSTGSEADLTAGIARTAGTMAGQARVTTRLAARALAHALTLTANEIASGHAASASVLSSSGGMTTLAALTLAYAQQAQASAQSGR
jgi:hypothetical protein